MRSSLIAFPQLEQNEAPIGKGEEQNLHFPPTCNFPPIPGGITIPEVVRSMRSTMINMNPRTMKILIGSEPLKKKNGNTKNTLSSNPPLPITSSIIPPMIHSIPIVRKF